MVDVMGGEQPRRMEVETGSRNLGVGREKTPIDKTSMPPKGSVATGALDRTFAGSVAEETSVLVL